MECIGFGGAMRSVKQVLFRINFNVSYKKAELLEKYAKLTQELGRLPVHGDLLLKARTDPEFPSHSTFSRLGTKSQIVIQLVEYCRKHEGYQNVIRLCEEYVPPNQVLVQSATIGFVYLVKSNRFYKIGKSNAAGRREYELALQLPEKATMAHVIRTDDPTGIEAYWHKRFDSKRKNGEWFELNAVDVATFKRRKFM